MLYRDFMSKYRPLMAPDGPAAGGGGEGGAAGGDPAVVVTRTPDPSPQGGGEQVAAAAAAAVVAPDAGAAAPAAQESSPSLLEAAVGKPKPDAAAAKPAEGEGVKDPAKDEPAPADAAKTDAGKTAEAEGEPKPKTEAELQAEAEAAKATDPDKKDATAEAQPPAPIKYEAFKVPEGVKLDDERVSKFAEIAGPAQVSQEVAQQFMDLHVAEIQRVAADMQKAADTNQRQVWNSLNDGWKTELRNDETLGGNRLETSLSMAKAVIEEYGGTPEQRQELLKHTTNNGMGNYPGFVRLLHNIGVALNVFEDSMVPANPQAPKATKSPGNRGWYDKTPGASA